MHTVCDLHAKQVYIVQGNLAKGRIAVFSLLAMLNAFVRRVRCAGTFASGGRRTLRNALMRRYLTVGWHNMPAHCKGHIMPPSNVPLSVVESGSLSQCSTVSTILFALL